MIRKTLRLSACVLFAAAALALPEPLWAACPTTDSSKASCIDKSPRPNIILFIADDLGWSDLPFFSPPVDYGTGSPADADGYDLMRPDRNRLAARMMARRSDESSPGTLGSYKRPALTAVETPTPYVVKPRDFTASHTYSSTSTDDRYHAWNGHGGMKRIFDPTGTNGFAFSRFYATSGVCAPTRGTMFTGRHVQRTGVDGNNPRPDPTEVTIAEYLKKGCPGEPCYNTALFGKWHFGHKGGKEPWFQGFDEFIGHARGCCRGHFGRRPFDCHGSPLCDAENQLVVNGRGDGVADSRPCDDDASTIDPTFTCLGGTTPGASCDDQTDCSGGGRCDCQTCVGGTQCCSLDSDCDVGNTRGRCGCNFSIRLYRDFAVDFIDRHQSEPFFLVVAFNAVHVGHNAPKRTQGHYRTNGVESRPRYWGMIDEMDASIGDILKKVDDLGLTDSTVVFFTSDQGSPGGSYGNPILRGGKSGVFDGGMRDPVLARACNCSAVEMGPLSPYLASQVDLFPTIAEAVGFALPAAAAGYSPQIGRCSDGKICATAGNCTSGPCVQRAVDGRSFYGLMVGGGGSPAAARKFAFAKYGAMAMVAQPGAAFIDGQSPLKMCGYAANNTKNVPLRGGSCKTCNTSCAASTPCRMLGKMCVPPSAVGQCFDPATGTLSGSCVRDNGTTGGCDKRICVITNPTVLSPCLKECTVGSCEEVHTFCNECIDAAWKLKVPDTAVAPTSCPTPVAQDDRLFDTATNPEEDDRLDCSKQDPPNGTTFARVTCELKRRLVYWDQCGLDDDCDRLGVDCQDLTSTNSCFTP